MPKSEVLVPLSEEETAEKEPDKGIKGMVLVGG